MDDHQQISDYYAQPLFVTGGTGELFFASEAMSKLHPTTDIFPQKLLLLVASGSIFMIVCSDLQNGRGSSYAGLPRMTPQTLPETSIASFF